MTLFEWRRVWDALDEVERALRLSGPGDPGEEDALAEAMDSLLRLRWVLTQRLLPWVIRLETQPANDGAEVVPSERRDGPVSGLRGRGA